MLIWGDLGLLSLIIAAVLGLFVGRRKWQHAVKRGVEIKRLMALTAEEASRAELEIVSGFQGNYDYGYGYVRPKVEGVEEEVTVRSGSSPARQLQYQCEVCLAPTKTRCKQCKAVRYCSGKCQIIHWRHGHKDKCHLMSSYQDADGSVHSSPKEFKEDGIETSSNISGIGIKHPKLDESSEEEEIVILKPTLVPKEKIGTNVDSCGDGKTSDKNVESLVDTLRGEHSSSSLSHVSADAKTYIISKNSLNLDSMEPPLSNQPKFINSDKGAAPIISSRIKSGCIDLDDSSEISTSSSGSDSGCEEHLFSKPSKLCPDFWNGTVKSVETNSFSSLTKTKAQAGDLGSDKVPKNDALQATSVAKKVMNEDALLEMAEGDMKASGPLFPSSKLPNHMTDSNISTECPSNVEESKWSFTYACHDLVSSLQSVVSRQPEIETDCTDSIPDNAKSRENDCPPIRTPEIHLEKAYVQNIKSGISSAPMKLVDKSRNSTINQHGSSGAGNGIKEGSFPYSLFVKLYDWKNELRPCGLANCGNSCYANAVLQCLAFTPALTAYFIERLHSESCVEKDWCFTCEFEMLVNKAKGSSSPLSPFRITSQVQRIGRHLSIGGEEDAHEFLRYVIDAMQSACLREAKVKTPSTFDEETTLMGLTFGGYLRSKIECTRCGVTSEQHDRIMDLTIEIGGEIGTLEEALLQFTRSEILDGDNKYHCGRCKSFVKAKKRLKILEAPNVLTIVLKRFESGKFGKLCKEIKFPSVLNIAFYMSGTRDKSPIYMLYGVIVHLDDMNSTYSGHYVAYVKNNEGKWFRADDSKVQVVELKEVLSKGAYMLLYSRCSPRAPKLLRSSTKKAPIIPIHNPKSNFPLPCGNEKKESDCLFQQRRSNLLDKEEEEFSSEESSSYFSEAGSHSTESSTNVGSTTSSDDIDDRSPCRNFSDSSETSSSSSSPSPLHVKQSLGHYESSGFWESPREDKGRNSFWSPESRSCNCCKKDVGSCRIGGGNNLKGGVYLRKSVMGRTDYY